ncbi:hypothetical protein M0D69_13805 [Caballeronia sp. SEWSISQ10-4 2]|uniref:hypothetical protein n=1 Tax=Caballeronia sp. SEWSISQ10-4 2 TaxID=2937438 RepID=UPI00265385A9|nr:hypothetical protein [Caballeronia sp. SEWSISQ10-4 2]MDN7179068.1 hypothetical protein [Caballeronia sp. SEWSISQ10-4 2]
MNKLLIAIAVLSLGACASADPISTGSGGKGFSISCNGSADSWGTCYKLATKSCGGQYEVIDKNQSSTPTGLGPMVERNMVVSCKA